MSFYDLNTYGLGTDGLLSPGQIWGQGLPAFHADWATATCTITTKTEAPVALSWNEIKWMIGGAGVMVPEYFKTEDEAMQKAKVLAAKGDNVNEVYVFKVVRRVRPVPKEVEVVDLKD